MAYIQVNGKRAFYACPRDLANGEKRGKVVVLVHGARGNHLIWMPQLRALARDHTPIAIDLPGHGDSVGPGSTDVSEYRDFLKGLVDALGLDSFVLAGHSMGGSVALDYALHYSRAEALILVGAGASWFIPQDFVDLYKTDFNRAVTEGMKVNFAGSTPRSIRELHEWNNKTTPLDSQIGDFEACNSFDVEAELGRIDVPTCVMCGDEDAYAEKSRVLLDKIPGAQARWLENVGHCPPIERPMATNGIFLEFLKSLG